MAKSKRRQKQQAERAQRRARKFARYEKRKTEAPSPETKYGARWWARRRGEPVSDRSKENPAWFQTEALRMAWANSEQIRAERLAA